MLKINERDNEGCTALICAAETGREDIMRALIQKGADLNVRNKVGMTAMNVAAEKGFIECVRVLLIAGANMNLDSEHNHKISPDEEPYESFQKGIDAIYFPRTPIESAACNGHTDIVKLLFSSGAYTDYSTLACVVRLEKFLANRKEIIELLLEHGVPTATENHPLAAYEEACRNEMLKDDAEILKLLGGEVPDASKEQKEKADSKPVMQQGMINAINSKNVEQLKKLIDEGADINAVNKDGKTALHIAAKVAQSSSVVQMLLDAGADVNAKSFAGYTALMLALSNKDKKASLDIVKTLVDAGAATNITCKCEVTAMFGKKKEKDVTPYEYALSELGKDDPVT